MTATAESAPAAETLDSALCTLLADPSLMPSEVVTLAAALEVVREWKRQQ